jgi:hypothetical protein
MEKRRSNGQHLFVLRIMTGSGGRLSAGAVSGLSDIGKSNLRKEGFYEAYH